VVECPHTCGAKFHGCKLSEHLLLCDNVRVPCINSALGCDQTLPRRDLVPHLPRCPASILACTQEWNRWPMHCYERLKTVPFKQKNPQAGRGQLDYELALRDQSMVGKLHLVPRRTKLALRNNLTRRFPALPLPREAGKSSCTDLRRKALREVNRQPVPEGEVGAGAQYGIAKVFLRNQEKQRQRWQEDVDNAILRTGQPVPRKYWEFPEFEKGNIHPHCAYCYNSHCDKKYNYSELSPSCAVVSCTWGCGAMYHHCKAFEHAMLCPLHEAEGEYDWMARDPEDNHKLPHIVKKKQKVPPPPKSWPSLLAPPCALTQPVGRGAGGRPGPPPPPPPPANLHQRMRFDIRMETVTRLQQKPRAMYTFLCGAELRRDQWEGHCKNVHSDIHGGLNNWLEARCPLSSYGCGFTSRRLFPGKDPGASIVYCQDTSSFGVRPPQTGVLPSLAAGSLSLEQLPVEVLQYVFSFLEPWSLASVALVSHRLRSVACSLLETKGCVALQWEQRQSPQGGWEVAYARWFFSPYFQPITHWGLHGDGAVSQHLQTCPYNIRCEHKRQDRNTQQQRDFIKALQGKINLKRDSEWFIK